MKIHQVIIKFPEINFKRRDNKIHLLFESFEKLFKDHLPILYLHFHNNTKSQKYPLIQYKVLNDKPILLGINECAELLISLFQQTKEFNFKNVKYKIEKKNINKKTFDIRISNKHHVYKFETPWMSLSQDNFKQYTKLKKDNKKNDISNLLSGILIGNILNFFKTINYKVSESILIKCDLSENKIHSTNKSMIEFKGNFTVNALLPDLIGLGNSVLNGYGSISKVYKK